MGKNDEQDLETSSAQTSEQQSGDETPNWLSAVQAAQEKQAANIKVLDLTKITTFTDYFVICNGSNTKQNQAIADEILKVMKERGERPVSTEGQDTAEWILLDYADFIVHIFTPKARDYYDLERLWKQADVVEIPEA